MIFLARSPEVGWAVGSSIVCNGVCVMVRRVGCARFARVFVRFLADQIGGGAARQGRKDRSRGAGGEVISNEDIYHEKGRGQAEVVLAEPPTCFREGHSDQI